MSGGALAVNGGVLLALNRLRKIIEINSENRTALVEPGVVNLDLGIAAGRYGLTYAPDPSSQRSCSIGGNISENAGGPHTLAYGTTTNHVLALELVTPNGEIHWLGGTTRDTPGYDLLGCVVGSEGTVGVVTKALVRLVPKPEAVKTFLAVFDSISEASNAVGAVVGSGVVPAALEMIDKVTIGAVEAVFPVGYPMDAEAVLLVEVDGDNAQIEAEGDIIESVLREFNPRDIRTATEEKEREILWSGRKGALGALGRIRPNYYLLDGVVPRTRLPGVLNAVYEIAEKYNLPVANVFHAGDGNLHPCLLFDERDDGATQKVLDAGGEIMRVCVDAGGAISGEHGIGVEKRSYLPWIFSENDLQAMENLRNAFGTDKNFNPCKIFPGGHGCGETHSGSAQKKIAKFGPDAMV